MDQSKGIFAFYKGVTIDKSLHAGRNKGPTKSSKRERTSYKGKTTFDAGSFYSPYPPSGIAPSTQERWKEAVRSMSKTWNQVQSRICKQSSSNDKKKPNT